MSLISQIKEAVAGALSEIVSGLQKDLSSQRELNHRLETELGTAKGQVEASAKLLEGERALHTTTLKDKEERISALEAELGQSTAKTKELEGRLADPKGEASRTAATIVAGLGVKPLVMKPEGAGVTGGNALEEVRAQIKAEKDPMKRGELARKARELRGHGELFKG